MSAFDPLHILSYIGVLTLVMFFLPSPLLSIYRLFLRPPKKLRSYGQYAVITGATDGIGRAYAFQLARQGLSLVLISRSAEKLTQTEADIHKKYPKVAIKTHPLDFTRFTADEEGKLTALLQPLDVGVLLNNVGMSYPYPEYYHALSSEQVRAMIELNVLSTAVMTRLVLPHMVSKRRGCVVNVSSFSSLISSPMLSQYSATKAYINALSRGLAAEYAGKGVHFQAQCPLYVTSKLSKIRKPSLMTPSPVTYAEAGVRAFGYEVISVPYWPHAVQNRLAQLVPESLMNWYVLRLHADIKRRAEKKGEKNPDTSTTTKKE